MTDRSPAYARDVADLSRRDFLRGSLSAAALLGVGATASSIVVSAFAFFRLVFAPGAGRLVTRLGERPVYLAGLIIVAVSTGVTAFAQSYGQLLLFRSLGGIGSTMFTVSSAALIIRLAPPAIRGRVSSVFAGAFLLGGVVGPLIGGLLGSLGLRVPFLVYAVALLVAAGVVALLTVVVLSYRQLVRAYPSGGGDYEVASVNLGRRSGGIVASTTAHGEATIMKVIARSSAPSSASPNSSGIPNTAKVATTTPTE